MVTWDWLYLAVVVVGALHMAYSIGHLRGRESGMAETWNEAAETVREHLRIWGVVEGMPGHAVSQLAALFDNLAEIMRRPVPQVKP